MKTNLQNRAWRWIAGAFFPITLLMILSERGFAKDTVYVVSDLTTNTEGNLNNAINAIITADPTGNQISNTVFKLESNGYYILTGTITTPQGSHLTIVAPEPGNTQETAPPQIVWTSNGGVTTTFNFDCYGDITMKNIWILCANTEGEQVGSSIAIKDDPLANLSGKGERLEMDGCIIDYMSIGNAGGAIEPACKNFHGRITNTYFRNMTDPHYRYFGRAVSWMFQSTEWHTDTLIFENCTFANCGYVYSQEAPEYGDYVSFNHCTFVNTMMYTLQSSYWWWLSVTNCLFVNSFMYGDIPLQDGTLLLNGGMINIDSVSNLLFSVPFTDSKTAEMSLQRHILLANNSYSHEQWYIDFLNSNPYMPANDADKIHRMPMMNQKTYWFLTSNTDGIKNFPYMNMINMYPEVDTIPDLPATYNASTDPKFLLNPVNIEGIKAFLLGRWSTGQDVDWSYNPHDGSPFWPLPEHLSYSNPTLKTASMGGFPLGDLYRWWPAQYASWKEQEEIENLNITSMLNNGGGIDFPPIEDLLPADNAQNQRADTLVLKWNSVPGAISYRCQLSLSPSFSTLIASDSTADTTCMVTALLTSTKYYWRVRAYSNDGPGLFSSVASFTTIWAMPATPTVISPMSNAADQPAKIKLVCSKASDAGKYHWQVSLNSAFSSFAANDSTTDTTFTTASLAAGAKYYWRVRGVNPGYTGSFTNADSFSVTLAPSVPILMPVAISDPGPPWAGGIIILKWHSALLAFGYEWQLSQNVSFSTIAARDSTMDTTHAITLQFDKKYYWRVRAYNIGGASAFSAPDSFIIPLPLPLTPVLVSPDSNKVTVARMPKFIWRSSKLATLYRLQVSQSQFFSLSVIDSTVVDTFMTVSTPLAANTLYFWRVRARNPVGDSPFNTEWIFATGSTMNVSEADAIPKEFALYQNYPNPFNPVTQIKYSIPQSGYITLKAYNLMGQEIKILFDGIQQPGNYVVSFDGKELASGMYIYRLEAGTFVETKKLILLK